MSFQTLFTKMEDHTLIITINRPEKLNALNQQVMQDLDAVFDRVYKFPEIKSVVITGAGLKSFVAGADIKEFESFDSWDDDSESKKFNNLDSDTCPHCFNTLKNEYPELGGTYEVIHHATFIQQLIDDGKIIMTEDGAFKGQKITYHDSCYLGRANNVYEAPRAVLEALDIELVEMKRCRTNGLCCGAGGAQMFKEAEKGNKEINIERTEDALESNAEIIATGCPFCNTMMTDGIKNFNKENDIQVLDVAELIANAAEL